MKVAGENVVASKINGVEGKPVRTASASAVQRRLESGPGSHAARPEVADDVHLTGAARNLAAVAQSLLGQGAIDEARVAAVKQKLDSGRYEVDPQRVADKLLRLEGDLAPLEKSLLK
jgi:negative regulator of flagellin synthesis FlgM